MIVHRVISTEKVPLEFRVAGINARFLALLIDLAFMLFMILLSALAGGMLDELRPGLGTAVTLLAVFGVFFGYGMFAEWLWFGQTIGKRLLGIRVISWDGTGVSFIQSAIRNIYRLVDGLPVPFLLYGVGFAVAVWDRENRRLGDLAAGTLVVHVEGRGRPVFALHTGGAESDRAWETVVRQRLGQLDREQKQTMFELCLRRDQLRVHERARLFRALADHFRANMDLAPQEFQSDEKFVLRLAAVLATDAGT